MIAVLLGVTVHHRIQKHRYIVTLHAGELPPDRICKMARTSTEELKQTAQIPTATTATLQPDPAGTTGHGAPTTLRSSFGASRSRIPSFDVGSCTRNHSQLAAPTSDMRARVHGLAELLGPWASTLHVIAGSPSRGHGEIGPIGNNADKARAGARGGRTDQDTPRAESLGASAAGLTPRVFEHLFQAIRENEQHTVRD